MKIVSSKQVLKNKLFTVVDEVAQDPSGFEIHRHIVRHPGSAVMLAVDSEERILLVKQFRLPAEQELWELTAGSVDPGESSLDAAKRELREETGYSAQHWARLVSFWASPGYVAEKMDIYRASGLTEGKQEPMEDERIETRWFAASEVLEGIRTGKIQDGKTIVGYFMWRDEKEQLASPATRL
jgi:ADP-ribose pyrophosphatase